MFSQKNKDARLQRDIFTFFRFVEPNAIKSAMI